MTIEIHNPELESMLQQQLKAGNFASVEDMLLQTFRAAPLPAAEHERPPSRSRRHIAAHRRTEGPPLEIGALYDTVSP
jgi:hypothetical protein